jgi:hypothetical protein
MVIVEQLNFIKKLLQILGFVINSEKSVETPSQLMEFLGMLVDSILMRFRLPEKKVESIGTRSAKLGKRSRVALRELASLLGSFTWAATAVPFAQAHYREVQALYIEGARANEGNLQGKIVLSRSAKEELEWWAKNLATGEGQSMFESEPIMSICADASLSGWGAECNGLRTSMTWSQDEAERHINELELLGAYNALRSFAAFERNCTVELRLDNTTAVAYINKKGGTHSESLTRLAVQVARWCEERNVTLRAQYLPGILNVIADRESRRRIDWSDWQLDPRTFQALLRVWKVSIDLFANPWNTQLPRFVSWNPQPGAWAWNAFSLSWAELKGAYAFPPFAVIRDCLSKARREKASILLICPLWPAQPWFPTLLSMACDTPRVLRPSPGLLRSVKGETNPLCSIPGFRLVAWKLSGRCTESKVFREKWSSFSWGPSDQIQPARTVVPGEFGQIGVWEGVRIPCVMI